MTAAPMFVGRLRSIVETRGSDVAIACAGEPALTYRELWDRALAVAGELRARGIATGEPVVLHLEKSPELVAAMIGCWMARAAFVPVLPELPPARRDLIIDETRARVVLDRPAVLASFGRHVTTELEGDPNDRAYIIYTSGSTGEPKGVVVSHRGVVTLLDAQIRAFDLRAGDRCLWMLSPAFDASISDVGTALLAGATLHIEHPARLRSPASLLEVIRARGITHVDLPPSLLPLLPLEPPPSLRTVVIGGEVCAPAAVRAWASRVRVVNVYGPTEATVCSTLCVCDLDWQRPLLGEPLPGVELRIEDGELWIGGPAVADGYLDRPELTAAKFVERDGVRWFRTGDRVVRHGDELVFLGRIDRQLKVNGVLVAPEEIEARLREHPAIADVAVVLDRYGGRDRLVAYYVASSPVVGRRAVDLSLRAHLASAMDARMLPRRFVAVGSIPRTESAKPDLTALVAHAVRPAAPLPSVERSPRTLLANLWCRVLDLDQPPDPDDNFFALGGDSFAVIELVALADLVGIQLAIEDVYAAPTFHVLAERPGRETSRPATCEELRAGIGRDVATIPTGQLAPPGDNAAVAEAVLLTGATGFLGRHVVAELLTRTDRDLICLVRNLDAARQTLERTAGRLDQSRVTLIAGDIARHGLGLGPDEWSTLADRVGAIVHCAAEVSLAKPYAELRGTNVLGVANVLAFARAGRPKTIHHASTLSVFVGSDRAPGVLRENDPIDSAVRLHGGYAQSKWAAECLLGDASSEPASDAVTRVSTYRFGLLTGHTQTGAAPERDWLTWFVRGLARVGVYPRFDGAVDLTPVDFAARAMVDILLAEPPARVFHIANPVSATLDDIVAAIRRAGVAMTEVSLAEFRARIACEGGELLAATLLGACRAGDYTRVRPCDVFQASGMTFDMTNTLAIVRELPPPGAELLARYVPEMLR